MSKHEREKAGKKARERARETARSRSREKAVEAGGKAAKRGEASGGDPEPPPEGRSTMQSDTPEPDRRPEHGRGDPRDGAAAIAPVTDAMMDHAAHEAAALADGVARGVVALDRAAAGTTARDAVETSNRAAQALVERATEATDGVLRAAGSAAQDTDRAVERGTEAARDALSVSADALSQYNAKVMEMMGANLASTTALFAALIQARSVPEALSLNADHLRRQMETLTTQGRELATLAQRFAFDAIKPFKDATDR